MVKGATAGTLQVFAGGDAADVKRGPPVLEAMGDPERVVHVGPRGAGYAVKLCLNLLWFIHAAAAAEVLVLGAKAGVEVGTLGGRCEPGRHRRCSWSATSTASSTATTTRASRSTS